MGVSGVSPIWVSFHLGVVFHWTNDHGRKGNRVTFLTFHNSDFGIQWSKLSSEPAGVNCVRLQCKAVRYCHTTEPSITWGDAVEVPFFFLSQTFFYNIFLGEQSPDSFLRYSLTHGRTLCLGFKKHLTYHSHVSRWKIWCRVMVTAGSHLDWRLFPCIKRNNQFTWMYH